MLKFSQFVVKNRWMFTVIFLILIVASIFTIPKTDITYDLSTYVPKGGNTDKSLSILKREFDDKGTLNVMIGGLSAEEAEKIASDIGKMQGIEVVVFNPLENYKDNNALYTVILDDYDSTAEANTTISNLINYLSDKETYLSGVSASSYFTQKTIEDEITIAAIIIVVLIFTILLLTSRSYFELVIMLVVFGVGAVINLGTNFLLGKIAFLSNVIGLILQLVLAIDYSIILLHRFLEERKEHLIKDAVVNSLRKGITEILSSSLTTIAGMCALMLMSLPIGIELGIVLAKGIVISLLTVIFLMPSLLVISSKLIERTEHKSFIPSIKKPISKLLSGKNIITSVFAVIIILAFAGQFFTEYSFNINGAKNIILGQEKMAETFGTENTLVVIIPKEHIDKEQELVDYMLEQPLINEATSFNTLEVVPGVRLTEKITAKDFSDISKTLGMSMPNILVEGLFSGYIEKYDPESEVPASEYRISVLDFILHIKDIQKDLPISLENYEAQLNQLASTQANFEGENYVRLMFNINAPLEDPETFALLESINEGLGNIFEEFYIAGESVAIYEMKEAFPNDNLKVIFLTALFILLILFLTFKNALIPFILILTIQGSVWINFAIPLLTGIPTNYIGYLLISAIQMGATIDYAIILTNRYLAHKKLFTDKKEIISTSVDAVFPTIFTSGTILALTGYVLGIATNEPTISSLGMLLGIGTSLSLFMVLFVLPSLLFVFDTLIEKATIRRKSKF